MALGVSSGPGRAARPINGWIGLSSGALPPSAVDQLAPGGNNALLAGMIAHAHLSRGRVPTDRRTDTSLCQRRAACSG
jgi:hypothetical protein